MFTLHDNIETWACTSLTNIVVWRKNIWQDFQQLPCHWWNKPGILGVASWEVMKRGLHYTQGCDTAHLAPRGYLPPCLAIICLQHFWGADVRWYEDLCGRSRCQGQGQVIILWDTITCPCPWYLPLPHKFYCLATETMFAAGLLLATLNMPI